MKAKLFMMATVNLLELRVEWGLITKIGTWEQFASLCWTKEGQKLWTNLYMIFLWKDKVPMYASLFAELNDKTRKGIVLISRYWLVNNTTWLVFRRKDLCEAKHDVVCVWNFAQNWTIWGGVNRTWRFEGKSPSTIYPPQIIKWHLVTWDSLSDI